MLWWKHLVIKLVLNSHIFTHIHCPSPQSEMRARVGNLLQGRSITSSSVAFNGVAEKVHLTLFDKMKQRCRKNLFTVLSVLSLKFLTNLLKAMNDRHIFSFRMNSGTLEMWEKFALHLMKMDLNNRILVDYRHRRWTVNGVTTPSVSTALKTIRCMFVLPHSDRSRLQPPFSWEKHKLLTCDLLHDVIFFKSWRYLRYFGCRNAASLPNQGEFVVLVRVNVRTPSAHRAFASTWAHDCTSSKLSDWWCPRTVDLNSPLSGPFS